MATTITPAVLQALQTDVRKIFQSAFRGTPTFYNEIATTVASSTAVNTYAWMKDLPRMREWLGPRVVNGLESVGYQLANKEYELTVGVRKTEIEDDQLGLFTPRVQMMAQQVAQLPDDLVLEALENGETATGFDGVAFFSTSHPALVSGGSNISNLSSASGGTSVLNATNFALHKAAMRRILGYDGKPLGINPDLLIVPPELEDTANTLMTAQYGASGATNIQRGQARVLVLPRLTDTNDWYLMDSSYPVKPFIFQNRKSPEFVSKINMNDDNVFYNKSYVWGADARAVAGYGMYFLIRKIKNTAP